MASCSQSGTTSPSTQVATLALLKWTSTPTITPTPRLRRTPTFNPATLIALTLMPTPLPLSVNTLNCKETPVGSLLCLGSLHNPLGKPISQPVVRVYLVDELGNALAMREVATARSYLLPDETTPYGAQFEQTPHQYSGAVAEVARALHNTQNLPDLSVERLHSVYTEGRYVLSGELRNHSERAAESLSLVATLYDEDGRVTGFRHWRLPPDQVLPPKQHLPFQLSVIPHLAGTHSVVAAAEGKLP
ncbi:MAG: FxLYD domain-containing protein [Aggregatilineales bacterium]